MSCSGSSAQLYVREGSANYQIVSGSFKWAIAMYTFTSVESVIDIFKTLDTVLFRFYSQYPNFKAGDYAMCKKTRTTPLPFPPLCTPIPLLHLLAI